MQSKYRPNLSTLMSLCDVNYMLLMKMLADKEQVGEQRHFFISDFLSYQIQVIEVTKYTSVVTIVQQAHFMGECSYNIDDKAIHSSNKKSIKKQINDLMIPKMIIRLYHDARVADVISSQDIKQIKPRYQYPNKSMHLPDEKQQINLFLKEWLQLCLQQGQQALVNKDGVC